MTKSIATETAKKAFITPPGEYCQFRGLAVDVVCISIKKGLQCWSFIQSQCRKKDPQNAARIEYFVYVCNKTGTSHKLVFALTMLDSNILMEKERGLISGTFNYTAKEKDCSKWTHC